MSLRAIARATGITAPGLYRYFSSRADLVGSVAGDIVAEILADVRAATDAAAGGGVTAAFAAFAAEFRRWSLNHRREFGLLFAAPRNAPAAGHCGPASEWTGRLAGTLLELLSQRWVAEPFPVPAEESIALGLRAQLEHYRDAAAPGLPTGAVLLFLYCWARLYEAVSVEVFGHLDWILSDASPLFDLMLMHVRDVLGAGKAGPAAIWTGH